MIRKLSKYLNAPNLRGDNMSPLNETFKALSDKTRRQILKLLRAGDLTAGEIADHFDMTKPSISHHLSMLKQADLISDRRQGQNIYYTLNTSVFEGIMGWFLEFTGKQPEELEFFPDDHDSDETPQKTARTRK